MTDREWLSILARSPILSGKVRASVRPAPKLDAPAQPRVSAVILPFRR